MRLVFCGTPDFAVASLQALVAEGHEVALVLTQPDRAAGRKLELQAPPVKLLALSLGLPLLQPEKLKSNLELRTQLEAIQPDAIVVVAYGRIIPDWMLALPRHGCLNVHGSLLPKYRGAAPIQWAVANGETETGVTTMRLDAGLDTGDILLERRVPIGPRTTAAELFETLAPVGAKALMETLQMLQQGTATFTPQDHAKATLAPILTREDGRLFLAQRSAQQVFNRWRGFAPWPGAHALFRGKRFLVHHMRPAEAEAMLAPNQLAVVEHQLLAGAAHASTLILDEVQHEGKPRLSGAQFARDFQLKAGEHLD